MSEKRRSAREWFEVDRAGLAKLLQERGKSFALFELIQNAWDQDVTRVDVEVYPVRGRPLCDLVVTDDDPAGFADLAHAYTLFAESGKKADPGKRGRWNLGEKLVLAICESASIITTTGCVQFSEQGRRKSRECTPMGSIFRAKIRMTRSEWQQVLKDAERLIAPVPTTLNGKSLPQHKEIDSLSISSLPTVIADEAGNLKRTTRGTYVDVYEPLDGGPGWLYEMGIPVVPTGDKFDVNVLQKVPLGLDRNSVPPAYLRTVRVHVLNATADLLTKDDTTSTWVQDATGDERCSDQAMTATMDKRFGKKRVSYDPSDREASDGAITKGYNVLHGGVLSAGQWENARRSGAIKPAGQVMPTPKPYSDDPGAPPVEILPRSEYTQDMEFVHCFAERLGRVLLGFAPSVRIVRAPNFRACYGRGQLDLSLQRLGRAWFQRPIGEIVELLIHEFAHKVEPNHLSGEYHSALSRFAGMTVAYALRSPEDFRR
jgi:hypothetical protein